MPTYEYECNQCGATFEAFQSMKDEPLTTCQVCSAEGSVKRLIGAGAGLIFKGSGFYITDYKNNGANGKAGTGEGKSETKADGKSESKSESKSETAAAGSAAKSEPKGASSSASTGSAKD